MHGVGQLVFHLEWCPKYRYNMLRQERFKDFLAKILEEESTKLRCRIIEMGIEDDHVHLVIATRPSISISELLHQLKGRSSYELFRLEPKFRLRYPRGSFWSPGKFYRSVGDVDLETVRHYVRNQDHRQKILAM
ncbi:MAG: IS200/IS605 family transposase [Candidatus Marsarchaeota archaeon]|nr:IS200/IS605 family transposase [Candidatus Marsarchaeota archaeon]